MAKLEDSLSEENALIDWERFRPIAEELYNNKTEKVGHPNIDVILMIKILVLQQWYKPVRSENGTVADRQPVLHELS